MLDPARADASARIRLNSPYDHTVLAGRSVYYGALLYLGHLTGGFWMSVLIQSAIFVYLSYLFIVRCLKLPLAALLGIDVLVLAITPLSYEISYLMPDVFASFLLLATILLAAYWKEGLKTHDRIIVSAILLYSILAHATHLLLFGCVLSVSLLYKIFVKGRSQITLSPRTVALLFLMFFGGVGEIAFSFGTRLFTGEYPVRPPFIMARLIADGPGYDFLIKNCATKNYTVCRYVDRLPTPATTFLWSADPKEGVFNLADPATRRALASEQARFVFDVLRFEPASVISIATRNATDQILNVSIDQFFVNDAQAKGFNKGLPASYSRDLRNTNIVLNRELQTITRVPAGVLYVSVYAFSVIALLIAVVTGPLVRDRIGLGSFAYQQWNYVLVITLVSIAANAAICAILSAPIPRYQTRISWLPVFVLLAIAASLYRSRVTSVEVSAVQTP